MEVVGHILVRLLALLNVFCCVTETNRQQRFYFWRKDGATIIRGMLSSLSSFTNQSSLKEHLLTLSQGTVKYNVFISFAISFITCDHITIWNRTYCVFRRGDFCLTLWLPFYFGFILTWHHTCPTRQRQHHTFTHTLSILQYHSNEPSFRYNIVPIPDICHFFYTGKIFGE